MEEPRTSKMAMLRKLRRGSKDSTPVYAERRDSVIATQPPNPIPSTPGRLTFFDLPAEIRNEVPSTPVCGLLLASQKCRKEYLPLLYSTTPVVVDIKDFDFQNLTRVIGGLYSTELKALRANRRLIIRLRTLNCTKANLDGLRRWLGNRADSLDRLPWQYEVFIADTAGRIGCFRQSREIAYYGERLARLQVKLEDTLQWELQAIIAAFDTKGVELDHVLQGVPRRLDPTRRPIRGLAGGGIH
ncbi:ferrochelatase hem15 [Teratosphaeriaceae sp. CCFEE 6253]|nr:ferrochelatase hem15 [Teratosphaeriaceae sp. CCFEE 6253]